MKKENLPNHIAIIPDGNRRWAKNKSLPTAAGHKEGVQRSVEILEYLFSENLPCLTFWGLSTDNFVKRSKEEIISLQKIISIALNKFKKKVHQHKVRFVHLGKKDRLDKKLIEKINKLEVETKDYKDKTFNLALDYGGREELVRATRLVSMSVENENIKPEDIGADDIEKNLYTAGEDYSNIDLIIRTSGEHRLSGLMLWQAAYSEIYFEDKLFPDFTVDVLKRILKDFSKRERRMGR